jgi:hypothetical protein
MDMNEPLDATARMADAERRRNMEEGIKRIKASSFVRWVKPEDETPPKPEKYVVMVEEGGMAWLSTRSWSGQGWLNMNACERVSEWLDGLITPAEQRARNG